MGNLTRRSQGTLLPTVAFLALFPLALGSPGCGGSGSDGDEACTLLPFPGLATGMVQELQVLIEVRFVSASDAFFEGLGADLDLTAAEQADPGYADGGSYGEAQPFVVPSGVVGGGDPAHLLVPQGHVPDSLLPVAQVAAMDPFQDVSVFPFLPGPGCVTFDPASRETVANVAADFAVEGLAPATRSPMYTLYCDLLDDAQLASFLQSVAQDAEGIVVSSPRVLFYDRQRAVVMLRNRSQAVTDYDAPFAGALAGVDASTTAALTGPALDLVPRVSQDRTALTLEIRPTQVVASRPDSSFDVGPSSIASLAEVGIFRGRQVVSNVMMPDGGTLLIGGFRAPADTTTQPGVPFFREIPVVSGLKAPLLVPDQRELLILITPRIVN